MAQITITISGREYAIACEDGQEARILQLANILDEKAKAFSDASPYIAENMLLTMVALVLADELSESKKKKASGSKISSEDMSEKLLEIDDLFTRELKKTSKEIKSLANKIELL